jgi:hypothetical protein
MNDYLHGGYENDELGHDGTTWERFLAGPYDGPTRVDYSVLSVAVMTLGLIMMVEFFRHRLDHAATGRPFFTAVLEGVYAECK